MDFDKEALFCNICRVFILNTEKQSFLAYGVYEQLLYKWVFKLPRKDILMIEPANEDEIMDMETAMKTNLLRSNRKPLSQEQMQALVLQSGPTERETVSLRIPTNVLNRVKIKARSYDMGYQNMIKFLVVRGLDHC